MSQTRVLEPAAGREAIGALVHLGKAQFPLVLSNAAPTHKRLAAMLLARILGSAQSALHLVDLSRRADLGTVIRSLYEHVVMLAWITGGNHADRIARWQADDELLRGKADGEVSPLRGAPLLSPENRERIAEIKAAMGTRRPLPPLTDRAFEADADWRERFKFAVPKDHSMYSLRSAYSILYRMTSTVAHPTLMGLNVVGERTADDTMIQMEPKVDVWPTFGVVIALVGTALYISSDVLGSPRAHEVSNVFSKIVG